MEETILALRRNGNSASITLPSMYRKKYGLHIGDEILFDERLWELLLLNRTFQVRQKKTQGHRGVTHGKHK